MLQYDVCWTGRLNFSPKISNFWEVAITCSTLILSWSLLCVGDFSFPVSFLVFILILAFHNIVFGSSWSYRGRSPMRSQQKTARRGSVTQPSGKPSDAKYFWVSRQISSHRAFGRQFDFLWSIEWWETIIPGWPVLLLMKDLLRVLSFYFSVFRSW